MSDDLSDTVDFAESARTIHTAARASRAPTPVAGSPAPEGWTIYRANGGQWGWSASFQDAARVAVEAGPGAFMKGPWLSLLGVRPEVMPKTVETP